MAGEVPITEAGLEHIQAELEQLITVRRPDIIAKIKAAREHGDLSENFEYHAARNEQSFLETRIKELENIVKNHVIIQPSADSDVVSLLSTVTVTEGDGPEETYHLVGSAEADPGAGRISSESPIGSALVGRRSGEEVTVVTPGGETYQLRIVRIA
ncbi:MAG TPA: transcription elongation factor GreA [Candidatus Nitrosotalea sp.]|nr:transcription elongation factor GreA [Candidatus Nitrosotalea sp.]